MTHRRTISELLRQRNELGPLGALDTLIAVESERKRKGRLTSLERRSSHEPGIEETVEQLEAQLKHTQEELRYCRRKLGWD
jgi:hypothetical protein